REKYTHRDTQGSSNQDESDRHAGPRHSGELDVEVCQHYGKIDQGRGRHPAKVDAERSLYGPIFARSLGLAELIIDREENKGQCGDQGQADDDLIAVPKIDPPAV